MLGFMIIAWNAALSVSDVNFMTTCRKAESLLVFSFFYHLKDPSSFPWSRFLTDELGLNYFGPLGFLYVTCKAPRLRTFQYKCNDS